MVRKGLIKKDVTKQIEDGWSHWTSIEKGALILMFLILLSWGIFQIIETSRGWKL